MAKDDDMGLLHASVYRNLERPQELLGLEPLDLVLLGLVVWLFMLAHAGLGWTILAAVIGYGALRVFKRGKPPGNVATLLRFHLLRAPVRSAAARDVASRAYPPHVASVAATACTASRVPRTNP